MCLACNKKIGVQGENLKSLFTFKTKENETIYLRSYLCTHTNQTIELTKEQQDEIMQNSLVVIPTAVDLSVYVWAIQWPKDYKVKTLKVTAA